MIDKNILENLISNTLNIIFESDTVSRDHFRSKIKHLLEKLMKKLGRQMVEQCIPKAH